MFINALESLILNKIQEYLNENNITFVNDVEDDIFVQNLGFIEMHLIWQKKWNIYYLYNQYYTIQYLFIDIKLFLNITK